MGQSIIQVDAFTDRPFAGNPAAVCVMNTFRSEQWMQAVAQEMNLSETAFLVKHSEGFDLRWFTPTTEVDLCGHATLASAHVLWTEGHLEPGQTAQFHTKSGLLTATQHGEWIELNFPATLCQKTTAPPELFQALGFPMQQVFRNEFDYLIEVKSESIVRDLQPDLTLLKVLPVRGIIVTSRSKDYDFVSRFFAPGYGIDEDPVTGSAHCALAPYWRDRLGKDEFLAYQASSRGGIVKVRYDGSDRVFLAGQAVTVLKGELLTPA